MCKGRKSYGEGNRLALEHGYNKELLCCFSMARLTASSFSAPPNFSRVGSIQCPSSCSFHAESISMFASVASARFFATNARPAAVCASSSRQADAVRHSMGLIIALCMGFTPTWEVTIPMCDESQGMENATLRELAD